MRGSKFFVDFVKNFLHFNKETAAKFPFMIQILVCNWFSCFFFIIIIFISIYCHLPLSYILAFCLMFNVLISYHLLFSDILKKMGAVICVFGSSLVLPCRPRFGFKPPALFTSCTEQVILLLFCTPMFEKHLSRIALWPPKLSLYCVLSAVCTVWPTSWRMKIAGIKSWESKFSEVCHCFARATFCEIRLQSSAEQTFWGTSLFSVWSERTSHKSILLLTWWLVASSITAQTSTFTVFIHMRSLW